MHEVQSSPLSTIKFSMLLNLSAGMHGRGSGPSVPASDSAGRGTDGAMREGRRRPHVRVALCHVDFQTRADAAQIGADLC